MKKLVYSALAFAAIAFAACDDESYNDWASPIVNPQEAAQSVGLTAADVAAIDFATLTSDVVKVFSPSAVISDESAQFANYTVEFKNGTVINADAEGNVSADELKAVIEDMFGKAPELRTLDAVVTAFINVNGQSVKTDPVDVKIKATLKAPVIESAYYVIGAYPGWDFQAAATAKFSRADESVSVYDDPVFTITVPAPTKEDGTRDDYWFRFVSQSSLEAADWSGTIGAVENGVSDLEGALYFVDEGGHGDGCIMLPASDGAKFYKIELNMMDYRYKITPLSFSKNVYFIGSTDGWSASDQKLESANYDGVYTGYVYVADPNSWGLAGKFQREAGSWDNEINAGTFSSMEGCSGDNNIEFEKEGLYYIEMDLVNGSLKATLISNMNLVGDFNGWSPSDDAQQMTWNATDFCYEITGAGVNANGWKFTANNGWDINLGGDLTKLVGNGDNLSAVGSTIKLYPCRTTSDNIYATVE